MNRHIGSELDDTLLLLNIILEVSALAAADKAWKDYIHLLDVAREYCSE